MIDVQILMQTVGQLKVRNESKMPESKLFISLYAQDWGFHGVVNLLISLEFDPYNLLELHPISILENIPWKKNCPIGVLIKITRPLAIHFNG